MSCFDEAVNAGIAQRLKRAYEVAYSALEDLEDEEATIEGDRAATLAAFIPLAYQALAAYD